MSRIGSWALRTIPRCGRPDGPTRRAWPCSGHTRSPVTGCAQRAEQFAAAPELRGEPKVPSVCAYVKTLSVRSERPRTSTAGSGYSAGRTVSMATRAVGRDVEPPGQPIAALAVPANSGLIRAMPSGCAAAAAHAGQGAVDRSRVGGPGAVAGRRQNTDRRHTRLPLPPSSVPRCSCAHAPPTRPGAPGQDLTALARRAAAGSR